MSLKKIYICLLRIFKISITINYHFVKLNNKFIIVIKYLTHVHMYAILII